MVTTLLITLVPLYPSIYKISYFTSYFMCTINRLLRPPFVAMVISALFESPSDPKYRWLAPCLFSVSSHWWLVERLQKQRFGPYLPPSTRSVWNSDLDARLLKSLVAPDHFSLLISETLGLTWKLNSVILFTLSDCTHRRKVTNLQAYETTSNSKTWNCPVCHALQSQLLPSDLGVSGNPPTPSLSGGEIISLCLNLFNFSS